MNKTSFNNRVLLKRKEEELGEKDEV